MNEDAARQLTTLRATRCNYGDIRLAHADASQTLDSVSYAVSFDHGHQGIHSPHKSEVGRRLALKVRSAQLHATALTHLRSYRFSRRPTEKALPLLMDLWLLVHAHSPKQTFLGQALRTSLPIKLELECDSTCQTPWGSSLNRPWNAKHRPQCVAMLPKGVLRALPLALHRSSSAMCGREESGLTLLLQLRILKTRGLRPFYSLHSQTPVHSSTLEMGQFVRWVLLLLSPRRLD